MNGSTVLWTTVEVFATRGQAEVGGSALRAAGIPHRILAEDAAVIGPPESDPDGARLQVPSDRHEAARALLRTDRMADQPVGPAGLQARTDRRLTLLFLAVIALGLTLVALDALLVG